MRAISVWQPWASLIVHGYKSIETRSYPFPEYLLGQRVAIASTKQLKREQLTAMADMTFQRHLDPLGIQDVPMGAVLGTAVIVSCEKITKELVRRIPLRELAFGWYTPERYAWHLFDVYRFAKPIPCRGQQGIWEWNDGALLTASKEDQAAAPGGAKGSKI